MAKKCGIHGVEKCLVFGSELHFLWLFFFTETSATKSQEKSLYVRVPCIYLNRTLSLNTGSILVLLVTTSINPAFWAQILRIFRLVMKSMRKRLEDEWSKCCVSAAANDRKKCKIKVEYEPRSNYVTHFGRPQKYSSANSQVIKRGEGHQGKNTFFYFVPNRTYFTLRSSNKTTYQSTQL